MSVVQKVAFPRLFHHPFKKALRYFPLQQTFAILGKDRDIPNWLVQLQPDKPAVPPVPVDLVQQLPFAPDRVQRLQNERPQKLFRRNRGPPRLAVQPIEPCPQLPQRPLRHRPNLTQRMFGSHPLLQREIAEYFFCWFSFPRMLASNSPFPKIQVSFSAPSKLVPFPEPSE